MSEESTTITVGGFHGIQEGDIIQLHDMPFMKQYAEVTEVCGETKMTLRWLYLHERLNMWLQDNDNMFLAMSLVAWFHSTLWVFWKWY